MQRERYVLENGPFQVKVLAEWGVEDASSFTSRLYEYTLRGDILFELRAKKGSLVTEFVISIIGGIASAILYDLIKLIFDRLKQQKLKGKKIKPVHIFTLKEEYIITGDNNSKIPEDLKKELFD
jgi:hypothetical protein